MARIHIARAVGDEGFTRIVAAKRLDAALACDAEFVEMFLDEARVASKIRHRNVVPVLDVVNIDGEVIMVQELVHGAPLHRLFARAQEAKTRIPADVVVSIAAQTLAGLHAAHEAVDETGESLDIIHRDVSPQNIMIATDGAARLLDFGVAKTTTAAHITRTGTFKGKLTYCSPEQLQSRVTRQSDVYSLGVVLWELLVGERMHAGKPEPEVFNAIMQGTPPLITEALAEQREWGLINDATWRQLEALEPVVARALARELDKRYPTAAAMEHALVAAVKPALGVDVAVWLRSLAKDLLEQTEQLIAAEEASWRKTRESGAVPILPKLMPLPRSSTSLETEAAKPSALVRMLQAKQFARDAARRPLRWLQRLPQIPLGIADGLAVLIIGLLVLGSGSRPHHASAAAFVPPAMPIAAPAPKSARPAAPVAAAPHEVAPDGEAAQEPAPAPAARAKKRVTKPKRTQPANQARTTRMTDCSIPFYYEGSKKIFKPSCI